LQSIVEYNILKGSINYNDTNKNRGHVSGYLDFLNTYYIGEKDNGAVKKFSNFKWKKYASVFYNNIEKVNKPNEDSPLINLI
jgi:hypothetical protein